MRKKHFWLCFLLTLLVVASIVFYRLLPQKPVLAGHKVVLCIPVYGQSLALGEEAARITDFDRLRNDYQGRIMTENLDYEFGYFEANRFKQALKKVLRHQQRAFELSVYSMAEELATQLGEDTLICIFPGGQGTTPITELGKGTSPYNHFVYNIKTAYEKAKKRGWEFCVPAICWMQGESDITEYTGVDYKSQLRQFCTDINEEVKRITHQQEPVRIICYQTNSLARAADFNEKQFLCREMTVPQAQLELIRDDSLFWPSGPIYPYSYAREAIHIDGKSQRELGKLEAFSAIRIIRGQEKCRGLYPKAIIAEDNDVLIHYSIPYPPLQLDTIHVAKVSHKGFSVINDNHQDIVESVAIEDSIVRLRCSQSPSGCSVRYAVNGEAMKSGYLHGPRGNLRDANMSWAYQFIYQIQ